MSDSDDSPVYDIVARIHAENPLPSLDEANIAVIRSKRSEQINAEFTIGSVQNDEAHFYSLQMFDRELSKLTSSASRSTMEDWIVTRTNDVLGGAIKFKRRISEGATAEVWEAESRQIERALAVKYLRPDKIAEDVNRTALALAEMQNLFGFRHPNVVNVYEAGRLKGPHGEIAPFVMMEYVEGCTLEEWVGERKKHLPHNPVSQREAATICRVVAGALDALHSYPGKQILHLDIKPANILIVGGPTAPADASTIKIIDFGSFGHGSSNLQVGTVEYMADERFRSHPVPTPSWDIYSTGGLFYFLLNGHHPLRKDENACIYNWDRAIGEDARRICQLAMEPDPNQRYQSIRQLEEDLTAWLLDHPLPHARKNGYSWWEREKMLWKRSWDRNDLADHTQIVARMALVLAFAAAIMGVGHVAQVAVGFAPLQSFSWISDSLHTLCIPILIFILWNVRFNIGALKIMEPLLALIISFVCVQRFVVPEIWNTAPNWQELNRGGVSAFLLVAVLNISFASISPEWKSVRPLGWAMLGIAFFLRPLFESQYESIAMPIVLSVCEVVGCLIFANALSRQGQQIQAVGIAQTN